MEETLSQAEKIQMGYTCVMERRKFKTVRESGRIMVYDHARGIYTDGGRETIGTILQRELGFKINNHLVSEVEGAIRRATAVPFDHFDADPELLCVRNGILNIRTRELIKHDPDILFLRCLGAEYNPEAYCSEIRRFLKDVVSHRDEKLLQQFIGFILTGGYRYHKAFILVGSGDNGKTTFLNMLQTFVGAGNYSSLTLQQICNEKFLIPQLVRKLANIAPEMGNTAIRDTESLKSLTGESSVTVQEKNERGFTMTNSAKLIFACNSLPPAINADRAYYGRLVIIPFPRKFVKGKDMVSNYIDRLTTDEELSGLLNYALDGYLMLLANDGFDFPSDYAATRAIYQAWSGSTIHKFVAIRLVLDPEASIAKARLLNEYKLFCSENGLAAETETKFFTELPKAVGGEIVEYRSMVDGNRIYMLRGVRLNVDHSENTASHRPISLSPTDFVDE